MREVNRKDANGYRDFLRVDADMFGELLDHISPRIEKNTLQSLDDSTDCIGVGDGEAGRGQLPPKIRAKTILSGKNRVKFGHFVNFFGHISCKIREFC